MVEFYLVFFTQAVNKDKNSLTQTCKSVFDCNFVFSHSVFSWLHHECESRQLNVVKILALLMGVECYEKNLPDRVPRMSKGYMVVGCVFIPDSKLLIYSESFPDNVMFEWYEIYIWLMRCTETKSLCFFENPIPYEKLFYVLFRNNVNNRKSKR